MNSEGALMRSIGSGSGGYADFIFKYAAKVIYDDIILAFLILMKPRNFITSLSTKLNTVLGEILISGKRPFRFTEFIELLQSMTSLFRSMVKKCSVL